MIEALQNSYTAFNGHDRVATGTLREVAAASKSVLDHAPHAAVLIFHDATGRQAEVDFRGSVDDVLARLPDEAPPFAPPEANAVRPRGPGRPKLGVVAREITLLPRQWEWLNTQPGGASVALRKLVDEARRKNEAKDRQRALQETMERLLLALAGDLPGYEEATRAFYAKDQMRFETAIENWPHGVRAHVLRVIEGSTTDYWVQ